ncbi:acetyl-CoA hydrolase/transferase family protein [Leptolinea tardivitalis]|uniref:4-hydroxybutyrate CoA-transferase n=1 Tax=Leptolinea tardivitalis TaxID=229920 RepID=A0A0P6XI93_9CHLR|nr:acetyl-CoA hydrolase/transferase C-terminal domain-containing protein [Leptolinea tardivitalis]KPL74661.1 4-hydroxybutyrate CoA-transferase [Leptolinea tardivitalis]GAP22996.1 acetyl-CoA hydrolase [Leptolinea tardivitalis]
MDWKTEYAGKIVSADDAVRFIKSGQRVFLTGNCSVPRELLSALMRYAPEIHDVEVCQALTVTDEDYAAPPFAGHLRVNTLFISANVRKAVHEGRADFTPILLSEFPLLFMKGILPVDVALVHLSPPDDEGFCTFGIENGMTKGPAESSRLILAEINEQMPTTCGDTKIHISKLDAIIPVDYPLAEMPQGNDGSDPVMDKIGAHIGERIPDGATLQLGIGAIPDSVTKYLGHKKDLGIHSELISDGVIRLVENGVVTNSRKTIHTGKIATGFLLGSRKLHRWVDKNPIVEFYRTEYINNPFTIAKNYRMVAINSAIEVDLTGQICADSIGTRLYSGTGGQMDFIYGSSLAEEGMPIIALPSSSVSSNGAVINRIVPTLKSGAGVVTTRSHVHYIVTEYGMVDLYGKSIRQRAQSLISIAHPDFRDELIFEAKKLNYI